MTGVSPRRYPGTVRGSSVRRGAVARAPGAYRVRRPAPTQVTATLAGTGGLEPPPTSQDVLPASFNFLEVEVGDWSDDGPSSLHDIDGNKVYWNGSIGGAGIGDQWVEVVFAPITPLAAVTGIVVSQAISTGAGSGKTDLCLADGTVINTNTSTAGNASTFNPTYIADIIANGALLRRYGTDAALFASAAFDLDRVILTLFF